jgi:apolipoprotein N-acyltransferase
MKKHIYGVPVRDIVLATISGILLTASFPRIDWECLAWIALVPFFYSIKDKPLGVGFKLGFLVGLVHSVGLFYWISGVMETYGGLPSLVSWSILLLLVIYLSLYPALFGAIICRLKTCSPRYLWIAPFLWAALEYIRAFFLSGFPWENLGYSQYKWLQLIQISDIFGVYGLSALIVAVNSGLFELCHAIGRKGAVSWKPMLVVGLAMTGTLVYGTLRIAEVDGAAEIAPKRTVALIQGNIDQSEKWVESFQGETLLRYGRLTKRALESQPDLTIWPETALPFYLLHDEVHTKQVVELVRASRVYFVVGSPSYRVQGQGLRYYNSAYLLGPSGDVLGRYDKVHLVPYGEYIPFKKYFPFLGKIVEAVFPELAQAMARNGAQVLVNITNDAWFGTSSAPYQHLSMAVFRAVETRRALARAANTGISAFVDPVGRLLDKTPLFEEAIRTRSIPLMDKGSFYTRYGNLFAMGCVAIVCVFVVLGLWREPSVNRSLSKSL